MKKIMLVLIGLGFITFSTLSFAETYNKAAGIKVRTIVGKIESVNASKNLLVIKDNDTPQYETVRIDQTGTLQAGQDVVAVAYGDGVLTLK